MNILLQNTGISLLFFVYSTGVYSETWSNNEPWVSPVTYVPDGKPFAEFTCQASLEPSQWLSWYQLKYKYPDAVTKELKLLTTIQQGNLYENRTIQLILPLEVLDNNSDIYCSKQDKKTWSYRFVKYIFPILSESDKISIVFQTINTLSTKSDVQVAPNTFEDGEHDGVIQFTCWAYLKNKRDVLYWYQEVLPGPSSTTRGKLLVVVQQQNHYGYVKADLRKTLEPSDNDTHIYCVKGSVLDDGTFEKKGESQLIPIQFQKYILPLDAYVTKEPSSDILTFDKDILKLSCRGSEPVDGRTYNWHLTDQESSKEIIYLSPNSTDINIKTRKNFHRRQVYCALEYIFEWRTKKGTSKVLTYGELARSDVTTLLYRGYGKSDAKPEVTPDIFEDKQKTFIKFTCYAFARPGEVLSWYQSKGLNQSDILLRMIQLNESEEKWMWLSLHKTLEQSDKGTDIYCAKKTALEYERRSEGLVSRRITLKFERDIKPIELPLFYINPNGPVYFVANTTLQFACGGSGGRAPVDGRGYTWFRMDADNITIPENQNYNVSSNLNILKLFLNASYHGNELFCAQGYLNHIRLEDGSWQSKFYGEIARSNTSTLLLQETSVNTHTVLAVVLPVLLVAVLLAVALWAMRRRRRRRSSHPEHPAPLAHSAHPAPAARTVQDEDEDLYVNLSKEVQLYGKKAPPEVTYAVLELSPVSAPGASSQSTAEPPSEYAVIMAQGSLSRIHM